MCPLHVYKGKPRSICSVNFFRRDRKLELRSSHYIKKREIGNSQRVSVCACLMRIWVWVRDYPLNEDIITCKIDGDDYSIRY